MSSSRLESLADNRSSMASCCVSPRCIILFTLFSTTLLPDKLASGDILMFNRLSCVPIALLFYRCHQTEGVYLNNSCPHDMTLSCSSLEYTEHTIVGEWNLVCDRNWLSKVTMSALMLGQHKSKWRSSNTYNVLFCRVSDWFNISGPACRYHWTQTKLYFHSYWPAHLQSLIRHHLQLHHLHSVQVLGGHLPGRQHPDSHHPVDRDSGTLLQGHLSAVSDGIICHWHLHFINPCLISTQLLAGANNCCQPDWSATTLSSLAVG